MSRREWRRLLITTQISRRARRLHARHGPVRQPSEPLLGDRFAARPCAIYVARMGQSSVVWQPVEADYLGGSRYRIVSRNGFDEIHPLQYQVGQTVHCELSSAADGARLVAVSLA